MAKDIWQQGHDGSWIVWDGTTEHQFADETVARRYYERLDLMSAVKEWADLNRALLDQAQEIIDATARPRRLGQANAIPATIDATPAGEEVGDSGWTKERAVAVNAMWGAFEVWLMTPLDGVDLTPIQVLSMREA